MDLHAALLAAALDAALEAGRAVMPDFGRADDVRFKSPGQPVTPADLRADRILRDRLGAADPAAGWLSEETVDSAARLACERVWVVDPIDGTQRFLDGIPEFGISVALVERGEPVVAVIHNPATGCSYHAVAGRGAFRDGVPITCAGVPAGATPRLLVSSAEVAAGELAGLAAGFEMRSLGSTSIKLASAADGTGDVYLSRRAKGEWDVCAGALIVREAGGVVSDAAGAALAFNRPVPLVQGVLAGSPTAHALLLAQIREAAGERGPN